MKVRQLLAALEGADPDAEVLIRRDIDDEAGRANFKLAHIQHAFAQTAPLERIDWDIAHYLNGGPDFSPVVVLSDEPIDNAYVTASVADEHGGVVYARRF